MKTDWVSQKFLKAHSYVGRIFVPHYSQPQVIFISCLHKIYINWILNIITKCNAIGKITKNIPEKAVDKRTENNFTVQILHKILLSQNKNI